jgi:hypothetical protein
MAVIHRLCDGTGVKLRVDHPSLGLNSLAGYDKLGASSF